MAQRTLDTLQPLLGFDGKQIIEMSETGVETPIILKDVLLKYLLMAGRTTASDDDQATLYVVGFLIGKSEGTITLTTKQYDALKRLIDNGKVKNQQGQEEPLYGNIVRFQVKEMVDAAKQVDSTPPQA